MSLFHGIYEPDRHGASMATWMRLPCYLSGMQGPMFPGDRQEHEYLMFTLPERVWRHAPRKGPGTLVRHWINEHGQGGPGAHRCLQELEECLYESQEAVVRKDAKRNAQRLRRNERARERRRLARRPQGMERLL